GRAWTEVLSRPENAARAAHALSGAASRAAHALAADPRLARLGADPAADPREAAAELMEAVGNPARAAVVLSEIATRGPREATFAARIFAALPAAAQAAALSQLVRAAPLPLLRQILASSDASPELVKAAVEAYAQ